MQRIIVCFFLLFSSCVAKAQETRIFTDEDRMFWHAKELFVGEYYSQAYTLFRDLEQRLRDADISNRRFLSEEVRYYHIICRLMLNEPAAEAGAADFVNMERNQALRQQMAFYLGGYYYRKSDFTKAHTYFEQTDASVLSNSQIAEMKFQHGYSLFHLQQYDKALPLLNTVRQIPDHADYHAANYYYGFIAFSQKRYGDALDAFRKVENRSPYDEAVSFYIPAILYMQGQKDQSLEYARKHAGKEGKLYSNEVNWLAGHALFEKKEYDKALPFLEMAARKTEKIGRERMYELSYCYYHAGRLKQAVEGFRQLSDGNDSISQSAMYHLGDAYLRLGDKEQARNAFGVCAAGNSYPIQKEASAFLYGKLSYELGYQDIALTQLRAFGEAYPSSAYTGEARELLAALLASTNNYREALTILTELPAGSATRRRYLPAATYGRAIELINDGNANEAGRLLDEVLKSEDSGLKPGAWFWKGELAYRSGKMDDAARGYTQYLEGPSFQSGEVQPMHARYNLGYVYLRKENYEVARSFFDQVAPNVKLSSPELVQDAWLRRADCYFMLRDYGKARSMYATAIGYSWPSADYATFQQAVIAGISKPAEKVQQLGSFERKYPNSELLPFVFMETAQSYLAQENYREAIPQLQKIIRLEGNPGNLKPRAYLNLGIAHLNLNKNSEALDAYRKLITEFPAAEETEEALESSRSILIDEGKPEEYTQLLRSAGRTVRAGQSDSLAFNVAENRIASGDQEGALRACDEYLSAWPQGVFRQDALFIRSGIYKDRKNWKKAVEGYRQIADAGAGKFTDVSAHQAARISFFELEDYETAAKYFLMSKSLTADREQRLDAMRGLLRSQYRLKKWEAAQENARELLNEKSISSDDRVLAAMTLGRYEESEKRYQEAIQRFRQVSASSQAAYAAEARYAIAWNFFQLNDLKAAEKAALETISKSGSYNLWITRSYLLLGDIFLKQKDYFNARATFQSVAENSSLPEFREEARMKLELVTEEEKKNGKITNQ